MTDSDKLKAALARINGVGPINDPEAGGAGLTELLCLPGVGLSVAAARTVGHGSSASVDLYLSDGTVLWFESVRDFGTPKRLMMEVAIATGARPKLTTEQGYQAVVLLRALADHQESASADEIACGWGQEYVQAAQQWPVKMRDQADRWRVFSELNALRPMSVARDEGVPVAHATAVLIDENGARLVRPGWFHGYVKETTYISPGALSQQMERVGWSRPNRRGWIKATSPGPRRQVLVLAFYIVPPDWGTE
jgi:hypothetical protein